MFHYYDVVLTVGCQPPWAVHVFNNPDRILLYKLLPVSDLDHPQCAELSRLSWEVGHLICHPVSECTKYIVAYKLLISIIVKLELATK